MEEKDEDEGKSQMNRSLYQCRKDTELSRVDVKDGHCHTYHRNKNCYHTVAFTHCVNLSIPLFLYGLGSSYSPRSNLLNHPNLDDLSALKKPGKFNLLCSPEKSMVGQIFRPHHKFHRIPPLVDIFQFSHAIGSEMEMWVSKSTTVAVRFKGHIPENNLVVTVALIIFLEKGPIVRVKKPDAKPIP